MTAKPGAIH